MRKSKAMYAPRRESSAARYGFAGRSLRFRYWPKVMARSSVRLLSRASFVAGAEAPPGWSAVNASSGPWEIHGADTACHHAVKPTTR